MKQTKERTANGQPEAEVARINARQAILVALISSIASVAITLITTGALKPSHKPDPVPETPRRWMKIIGVDVPVYKSVRILALVNGRAVSYPTNMPWAKPNPTMPVELFPLEAEREYKVQIELMALDAGGDVKRFVSGTVQTFLGDQLPPIAQAYQLHEASPSASATGDIRAQVYYQITDRPN